MKMRLAGSDCQRPALVNAGRRGVRGKGCGLCKRRRGFGTISDALSLCSSGSGDWGGQMAKGHNCQIAKLGAGARWA